MWYVVVRPTWRDDKKVSEIEAAVWWLIATSERAQRFALVTANDLRPLSW